MPPFILAVETSSRIGSVAIAVGEKLLAESSFAGPTRHSAELFPSICHLLDRFSKRPDQIEHVYISVGPGSFTGLRIAVTMAKIMSLASAAKIVAVDSLDVTASNVINLTPQTTSHEPRLPRAQSRGATPAPSRVEGSNEKVAVILDAKRNQFFVAVYKKQLAAWFDGLTIPSNIERENTKNAEKEKGLNLNSAASANSAVKGWKKVFPDSLMTSDEFLSNFARKENPIWLLGDGLLYHRDKFKADGIRFFDEQFWSPCASKVHLLGYQLALAGQFSDALSLQPNYLMRPDIKLKPR
jgi:tRNA threonylcarbamoyladenosine biosynthesis protein TsaB